MNKRYEWMVSAGNFSIEINGLDYEVDFEHSDDGIVITSIFRDGESIDPMSFSFDALGLITHHAWDEYYATEGLSYDG